ncbi:hypothetical protein PIB30_048863, partial [Stylosanthes scabra]|nr:hypothetical protein [Stylosanthes scabra]
MKIQELDLDIELGTLSLKDENEWDATNVLDNIETPPSKLFNSPMLPTFLQSDLTTVEEQHQQRSSIIFESSQNHENNKNTVTGSSSSSIVVGTQNKDQTTTDLDSIQQEIVAPTATIVHHASLSSPFHEILSLHPSSPKEGLILEREGSSSGEQDMSRMGWFNQFPHNMQHENSHRNEGGGIPYQHNISNNSQLIQNNYNFQVEARAGTGIGYHSNGQFITNQRSGLQNNIMNPHTAFISRRPDEHHRYPNTNMYDSQYRGRNYNYMHHDSSSSFSLPLRQDGYAPPPPPAGIYFNNIYDLDSQNSFTAPPYPLLCSNRAEPEAQPAFVQVPPNHAVLSYGPLPMYSTYPSHHPQPAPNPYLYATTTYNNTNPFCAGPSLQPSKYPPSYDNNNYNPQTTIPQQFTGPQGVVGSSDHQMNGYKYNQQLLMNNPPSAAAYVEQQSYNTMMMQQDSPTSTEAVPWTQQINDLIDDYSQQSWSAELLSGTTPGSSSQDSNSNGDSDHEFARLLRLVRPENASRIHKEQQVITKQRRKGKHLAESFTTREPSPAIRRILDMSSKRTVIRNPQANYQTLSNSSR